MHERLSLHSLDRPGFQTAMARCGRLICQPGLYTPYEAIAMNVPFALTYPMSFTQDRQWALFREMGVACCEAPWSAPAHASPGPCDIDAIEGEFFAATAAAWSRTSGQRIEDCIRRLLQTTVASPSTYGIAGTGRLPSAGTVVASYLEDESSCKSV